VDAEIYHIHLLNNNQLSGKVIGMELDIKNGLLIAFSDSIIKESNLVIWDHSSDIQK
jgi:hypothetical protein